MNRQRIQRYWRRMLVLLALISVIPRGGSCCSCWISSPPTSLLTPAARLRQQQQQQQPSTPVSSVNNNFHKSSSFLHSPIAYVLRSSLKPTPDDDDDDEDKEEDASASAAVRVVWTTMVTSSPLRTFLFSTLMVVSGATLGPFLDSFHSAFGVLSYNAPITLQLLWGSPDHPALITSWWVPELFGLAGFLIGWLYILLDAYGYYSSNNSSQTNQDRQDISSNNGNNLLQPLPPKILLGISFFTFQYWLSGALFRAGVDRTAILNVMSVSAALGFVGFDGSLAGFLASTATAVGGPLIEIGLLTLSRNDLFLGGTGYHYNDLGETGFFPLWIIPIYFLGGPANGNLARGYWNAVSNFLNLPSGKRIS